MEIILSVCLLTDFPERIEDSFYHGKVSIIFEASSPSHHDAKMYKLIGHRPIMFLYFDGEPDH